MPNINYSKLGLFITFNILLLCAVFLLSNQVSIPDYLVIVITSLGAAIVGLQTNINESD